MSIYKLHQFFEELELTNYENEIASRILNEIKVSVMQLKIKTKHNKSCKICTYKQ